MASIIEFPHQRTRTVQLRGHLEAIQHAAEDPSRAAVESVLALIEQIQRTNAAIKAYRTEMP
ncbi:hypothetical protein ELG81_37450 [Rhizobium leguminosarum]|uniref:hypothetical protein n=1 Tax=Rhizobium leguminosarum TaxID=384 RepID=UPI00102F87BA|nr:hypothetical protein [Rhizobium leguminosarum]TBG07681.1 hypothetical protein ELG81_37450 [Rhizobium leguminosarum]